MLVILKSGSAEAARNYFDMSLRLGDYYREGEQVVGKWHGLAAARLGLLGDVTRRQFCALIDNRHPRTGERLTPRMKANRVPGFDFTFTAPKSVSLLYAMTGDERITEALRASVADAMAEIEREMKTRVRVRGKDADRVTGNMVWAEFLHHTARPIGGIPDPHLHIHAYAMNVTYDVVEGRWKAAQMGDIKKEALYFEAVFHAALARRMAALGHGIDLRGRFFEITGMERSLLDKFSQRKEIIERAARGEGSENNPEAKRLLSRLTRERKAEALSVAELCDIWKARLFPQERRRLDELIVRARHGLIVQRPADARWLSGVELGDALRSESAVSEKSVLTRVLRRGFGSLVSADARAAIEYLGIIRGEVGGQNWITTKAAHELEAKVVAFARRGRNACAPMVLGDEPIRADWLNGQQQAAVRHIWRSQDRVIVLRGGAGVGKTTLM
ncbi:MAG: relaxase domain-containing protein, partial [Hyphomicrobiales bacterium]|nr:relaxase domain-containing protein [Hyphomicrobiales bacterium]